MEVTSLGLPMSFTGDASYRKESVSIKRDTLTFPRFTNKTTTHGRLSEKAYLIRCNGDGTTDHILLQTPTERIQTLHKFLKKGYITQEEYDQKKKEILKDL